MLTLSCPHLTRRPSRLNIRVIPGPLGTFVVQATVAAGGRDARAVSLQPVVGTVSVTAGTVRITTDPDPATGLAVFDLPRRHASWHSVSVSYSGDAILSPSRARTSLQ